MYLTLYMALWLGPGLLEATNACYSPQEYEADRGLRLHTDLEVITLTCKYAATTAQPLRPQYDQFVKKYGASIRTWQDVVARAYAGTGGGRDEIIDNFRTALANKKSYESASMGPKNFCAKWSDFPAFINGLQPQQVYAYLRANDASRPTKRPLCGR